MPLAQRYAASGARRYPDWANSYFARFLPTERAPRARRLASRAPLGYARQHAHCRARGGAAKTRPSQRRADAVVAARDCVSRCRRCPKPGTMPSRLCKGLIETRQDAQPRYSPAPRPASRLIDLAAGAGGKTLALAAAMENRGQIYATDIDKRQLVPIHERLARAGARNIQVRTPRRKRRAHRSCGPRRSGADRRALHRHRHVAAQSRRQVAHPSGALAKG